MPRVQPLLLALLAFALPATAQASSVTVAMPSGTPNYWEAINFTVSGVADQDAKLLAVMAIGEQTCPALYSDTNLINTERAGWRVPVSAGSYSVPMGFLAPRGRPYDSGSGPGPRTVCVYLMPASYDRQYPSPAALAVGTARITLGPDCLGFRPVEPATAKRLPGGAFGQFALSGEIAWPVSMTIEESTSEVGPGVWTQTYTIPDEGIQQLKKGLQVYESAPPIFFTQACKAPDGSAAPAPYDTLYGNSHIALMRVDGDGNLLGPNALPNPTFAGALALGTFQTPYPTGKGEEFEREVRVKPVGGRRPALIATGKLQTSGAMTVKLTSSGKKVIAALGKKAKRATLHIETTAIVNDKPVRVTRSTMQMVRDGAATSTAATTGGP
jgi:hypothetical protein